MIGLPQWRQVAWYKFAPLKVILEMILEVIVGLAAPLPDYFADSTVRSPNP